MKAGMKVTFSPSSGGGGGGGGSNTRVPRCEKASTRSGVGAVLSPGSRRVSGEGRGSEVHPVAGSEGPPVLRANGSGDGAESAVDMGQSERIQVLRWMERLGVKVRLGRTPWVEKRFHVSWHWYSYEVYIFRSKRTVTAMNFFGCFVVFLTITVWYT